MARFGHSKAWSPSSGKKGHKEAQEDGRTRCPGIRAEETGLTTESGGFHLNQTLLSDFTV